MGQQGVVTITGFVGGDPTRFGRDGGSTACSFRVGSTRSYFHAASGEWREHPTTWMTVKAFRSLADHILGSLHTGDPVIVTGLLGTETWKQDGNPRSRVVIEATSVGHDLVHGVSAFIKSRDAQRRSAGTIAGSASDDEGMAGVVVGDAPDDPRQTMSSARVPGQFASGTDDVAGDVVGDVAADVTGERALSQTVGVRGSTGSAGDITAQSPIIRSEEAQEFAAAGF